MTCFFILRRLSPQHEKSVVPYCLFLIYRTQNSGIKGKGPLKVTEWDAFGYYLYIPSIYIYYDYKELKWCDSVDRIYHLAGSTGLPVQQTYDGHYVNQYLGGVALMQIPLFCIAHWAAKAYHYPADGYSQPYQHALGFGIIFYCLLAVLILRRVLLFYFKDAVVAVTLLLICLATNFIQYAAVDNGQSHAYIFLLYALVIYATIK